MAEISPFLKEAQQTGNEFIAGITPVNPRPTPSYDPQANQSFGQNFYDSATMTPPANLLKYLYDRTVETQVKGYRGGGFYGKPLEAPTPSTKFDLQSYLADDPEKLGYAYLFSDIHNREIADRTWATIKGNEAARERIAKNHDFWAGAAAEFTNPINYIPGASITRGVGFVRGFVRGMGAALPSFSASEAIRLTYDPTSNLDEAKTNLLYGTALLGLVGGAVGMFRKPVTTIAKNLADETRILVGDPVTDASITVRNDPLADTARPLTSVAQGIGGSVNPYVATPTGTTKIGYSSAGFIGGLLKKQGPFARVVNSGFRAYEDLANRFAGDNGVQFARNEDGIATETSAWLASKRWQNMAVDLTMTLRNLHANYIMGSSGKTADAFGINLVSAGARTKDFIRSKLGQSRPDGKLMTNQFDNEVLETYFRAQETGVITHEIPEIAQGAAEISRFMESMLDQGIKSGYFRTPQNMSAFYLRRLDKLNPAVTEWRSLVRNKNKTDQQIALQANLKTYINKLVREMKYSRPKTAPTITGRSSLKLASTPALGSNDNIEKVLIDPPMRDIKVQYGPTGKTRPDGTPVNAFYNETDKTVFFDYEATIASFNSKPWTKPKVEGVDPLPENAFETPEEWAEFVLRHELNHTSIRRGTLSTAEYENLINRTSLEQMDDISNTHQVLGMKQADARLVAANENVDDVSNFKKFYFPHRYRPDLIVGREEELEKIFFDHFKENPNSFEAELLSRTSVIDELKSKIETAKPADAKKFKQQLKNAEEAKTKLENSRDDDAIMLRAKAAVQNILHHGEPFIGEGPIPVGSGRAFFAKRRAIDIPTAKVKDFIENDLNSTIKYYTHRMGLGSEYTAAFGTPDGELAISEASIQAIRESEGKSLAEINDFIFKNEDDIRTLRDFNMGRYHQADQFGKEEAKILRSWFVLSTMGKAALASMTEVIRPMMVLGFKENFETVLKALGDINRASMALKEIRDETTYYAEMAQGELYRRVVDSGFESFGTLTGKYNSVLQKIERPLSWAQTPFYLLNGLTMLTYFQKAHTGLVASSVFCKRILRVGNGTATKDDMTFLASYGIGKEEALLMAKEPIEKDGGAIFANTKNWSNKELGRQYYRAVDSLINRTIVTSSAADKPAIAMGIVGRGLDKKEVSALALPFQLKTWGLAANNKVLLSALQGRDANVKSGMLMMVGVAYYVNSLKVPDYVWDKMSEEEKIANAVDSSGILALLTDVNFAIEQTSSYAGYPIGMRPALGIDPKLGDPDVADAAGVLTGPATQKALDTWLAINGGTSKDKARAIINALPGQNMIWIKDSWKKLAREELEGMLE